MADCPGIFLLAQMKDGGLARLRLPGGRLDAAQGRAVADFARRWGNGLIDLTNRANLQVRGLPPVLPDDAVADLDRAGLVPAMRGADRLRNITADPLSGLDPGEITDVTPLVADLDAALVERLADLAAAEGDGQLRLTPWSAVLLTGIPQSRVAAVIAASGLGTAIGPRVVACAGSTGCERGLADTKGDGRALAAAVGGQGGGTVHLAGCSKGCAHPGAADILALAQPDGTYDLHRQARAGAAASPWAQGVAAAAMIDELARAS